ncbi:MAG: NADH:flavin oxidoreductase [Terriglobia bacterium]
MRSYFHYQSLEELAQAIQQLDLSISLESNPERIKQILARPVRIGAWTAGNSLAIHPMEGCDGTLEGKPGELTIRRYERFGRGGAKLLWFEATAVVPEGRATSRQLLLNANNAKSFDQLLSRTRKFHAERHGSADDLVEVLQLTHSGRYSSPRPLLAQHHPGLDPLTYLDRSQGIRLPADYPLISDEELERLEINYLEAARLAKSVGFKGVDIKLTHGYLGNELLGARTRPGRYGGSFENRIRFARNVISRIRSELGSDFLLATRLGAFDGVPFQKDPKTGIGVPVAVPLPYQLGFGVSPEDPLKPDLQEPLRLIEILRDEGVKLFNISLGNPYVNPHIGRPFEKPDEGNYWPPEHPLLGVARHFEICSLFQEKFPELAFVGTGYSWLQHFQINAGAANIRDGKVTLMGVGRGALAYPDFAQDALTLGKLDPAHTCKTLTFCTYLMRQKHHPLGQFPTGCPPFDKEIYGPIIREARKQRKQTGA